MARSFVLDPMLSHNFALIDVPMAGVLPIVFAYKLIKSALSNGSFVGMKSIRLPTMTLQTREVVEGNWPYTHQVGTGRHSGGECVLTQAVLALAPDMYAWFLQGVWGRVGPRRHFMVAHLRADKALPARVVHLRDCVPISWTPSSDLDAETSSVCMEELTMNVNRVDIIPIPTAETIAGA